MPLISFRSKHINTAVACRRESAAAGSLRYVRWLLLAHPPLVIRPRGGQLNDMDGKRKSAAAFLGFHRCGSSLSL